MVRAVSSVINYAVVRCIHTAQVVNTELEHETIRVHFTAYVSVLPGGTSNTFNLQVQLLQVLLVDLLLRQL